MKFENPVILSDYSDPDAIRYKDSYYMIASSFNHVPGVPVLKSKNLVDWKIINYVFDKLPFERYNKVCHGDGAWAPSLRYHNGLFYAIIPFPDEGIFISSCTDIEKGDWSPLWCLFEANGVIDPCPIWDGDKCYLAVGFAKSRIGFNSMLGVYEVSPDLKRKLTDYKIVFDGHYTQPTIEGPKFYKRKDYYYIMAPAGSVKTGWQVCLRSKNIYGPYEEKIVMMQGASKTNGPHQGALVDIDEEHWAFLHFQDMKAYGRVVHLQPVQWLEDWPVCGKIGDPLLPGIPYEVCDYLIDEKSDYTIPVSDEFVGKELSFIWQTPANKTGHWYDVDHGLTLYCSYFDEEAYHALNLTPNLFLTKLALYSFTIQTKCHLNLIHDGDEVGLCYMGSSYTYACITRRNNENYFQIRQGKFKQAMDEVLFEQPYSKETILFTLEYTGPDQYQFGLDDIKLPYQFTATPGRWIGGKYGIYAKGLTQGGKATFDYFRVEKKNA